MFKIKYICIILAKDLNGYDFRKKLIIKKDLEQIKYKNHLFDFNIEQYIYRSKLSKYYFFDLSKKSQIYTTNFKIEKDKDTKINDLKLAKKIIAEISAISTIDSFKLTLMNIGIGLAIGGLAGYIAGFMIGGG